MIVFETDKIRCEYRESNAVKDMAFLVYTDNKTDIIDFSVLYESDTLFTELDEKCQVLTAKMLYKIRCAMPDVDACKMLDWLYENVVDPEKAFNELVLII